MYIFIAALDALTLDPKPIFTKHPCACLPITNSPRRAQRLNTQTITTSSITTFLLPISLNNENASITWFPCFARQLRRAVQSAVSLCESGILSNSWRA
uniref:Uncharacterized protein n=1 Tax=Rhizophora mucronata TaxID=61149 RepID=A0A2P2NGV4_RHIMU